jgi:hypothetical protein
MIIIDQSNIYDFSQINPQNSCFRGKVMPAIEIHKSNNECICDIGYYSFINNSFQKNSIQIGNVIIKSVFVSVSTKKSPSYKYAILYHYSINIEIVDDCKVQLTNSCQHSFNAVDKVIFHTTTKASKIFCQTFPILFSRIIPSINLVLKKGVKSDNINFNFYDLYFKELKRIVADNEYVSYRFFWTEPEIEMKDILHFIYNLDVHEDENCNNSDNKQFIISSKAIDGLPANAYIQELIGVPVDRDWTCPLIWKIPEKYKKDSESVKKGLLIYLFYKVLISYDDDLAQLGFRIKKYISHNIIDSFPFSEEEESILNFILNMKVGVYEDGISRVGRDDWEWTETIYEFDYSGYKPNDDVINRINMVLGIKLEENENGTGLFYKSRTKHEIVPYFSWRRGNMDDKSREPFFIKVFARFINNFALKHKKTTRIYAFDYF